jgi:beta-glucanase (GH16 family)
MKLPVYILILLLAVSANVHAQHCLGREPVFFGGTVKCSEAPYKLVFYDEFEGTTLDINKWYTYGPVWPDNNDQSLFSRTHDVHTSPETFKEMQIYKDENVVVSNGTVKLKAKKETNTWYGVTKEYSSGYLQAKTSFRYGKIEVRFKLPSGSGFWPAIWLWGNGIDINGNSTMHEIDIVEHCGEEPSTHHVTFHYKNLTTNCDATQSPYSYKSADFTTGFHTVTCEFNPQFIKVYCDDILVRYEPVIRSISGDLINCNENVGWGTYLFSNFTPTIFQSLILNLAISSENNSYCDPVNANTNFPAEMEIDYVKLWQQNIQTDLTDLDDIARHFFVYPNPASTSFKIEFSDDYQSLITHCRIYHSITSKMVASLPQMNALTNFDCSAWEKGVYIIYLNVSTSSQPITKLLMVQ